MTDAGIPSFAFAASARVCRPAFFRPRAESPRRAGFIRAFSDDLEIALQLPIGHTIEPLSPLPVAGRGKMIDEVVAEPVACEPGSLEVARGLDQRSRRPWHILPTDIGPVYRLCGELEVLLDAVQARGDAGRGSKVRVHVCAWAARLEARRLRRSRDDAKARGTVVQPPGWLDRCPEAVDEPFVAVDRRPVHRRELHQAGELSGEIALEELAHAVLASRVCEEIRFAVGERLVDVARAARI